MILKQPATERAFLCLQIPLLKNKSPLKTKLFVFFATNYNIYCLQHTNFIVILSHQQDALLTRTVMLFNNIAALTKRQLTKRDGFGLSIGLPAGSTKTTSGGNHDSNHLRHIG